MKITSGKIQRPQKIVVYGPEGIGKSTFASRFPMPIFIDTEGGTAHLDVERFERPTSWEMLLSMIHWIKANRPPYKTVVIDTADWAETLCAKHVCAKGNVSGIEDYGYGKGYTYLAEEFGKFLNYLEELVQIGYNVLLTAHAAMRKFEQPDEIGSYDRWELKLQKKTAPLLKEWADTVLFANYKTMVEIDPKTNTPKAYGGKRTMYSNHRPVWDAKNRYGLPDELPFDYSSIAHIFDIPEATSMPKFEAQVIEEAPKLEVPKPIQELPEVLPRALRDLMQMDGVTEAELSIRIGSKSDGGLGYFPSNMPFEKVDTRFWNHVIANWRTEFFPNTAANDLPFTI